MFTLTLMALACDGIKQAEDLAPMITDSSAPDGSLITLYEDDDNAVWVNVYDEDMDSLSYNWSLSEWGVVNDVQTLPEGSMIKLPYDLTLHDQQLTCLVSDAWSSTRIDWILNVPEAM
jgi:hypothetical protein